MARLPKKINEEIVPEGERVRIYFKSPNGSTFRVNDRRKSNLYKYNIVERISKTDPYWMRMSDWNKSPQYVKEDTHFGGEDMAMMFRNYMPTFMSVDIPDISAKDFFTSAFDEAVEKVQKDIDKINKAAKKASKGIRDSLDLSKK